MPTSPTLVTAWMEGLLVTRVAAITVLAALAVVSSAGASVEKVSLTTPVRAGHWATLTVKVSPRSRCSILVLRPLVRAPDGVVSFWGHAFGGKRLRRANADGTLTWRWKIDQLTPSEWRIWHRWPVFGRWSIHVNCGESGGLRLALRVLAP